VLNLALPRWEAAMGSCFHFELVVRLLANASFPAESVTRDVADGKKGHGLLTLLFGHLTFSEEEKTFLIKCNTLRNKLIHCEPDAIAKLAKELNPTFSPPPVAIQVNISESPRESLVRAVTTGEGAIDVRTTRSRTEGFLGWILQAAGDGTFDEAVAAFGQGIRMLDSKAARV
jgi:hypothetical protein